MEVRFFTTGLHIGVFKSSDKPRIFLCPPTCADIDRDRRRERAICVARAPPRRSTPFVRAIVPARSHGLDLDAARGFPIGRPSASRARSASRRRSPRGPQTTPHVLHVQEVLALPVAVPRGRAPGKARGGVRRQRARRREQKEASRDARGGDGGGARGGRRRAPRRSDARATESPLRALRARTRVPSRARRRERLGDEPDRLR